MHFHLIQTNDAIALFVRRWLLVSALLHCSLACWQFCDCFCAFADHCFVHPIFLSSSIFAFPFSLFFAYYNPNTHSFVHKHRMSNGIVQFSKGDVCSDGVCVGFFFHVCALSLSLSPLQWIVIMSRHWEWVDEMKMIANERAGERNAYKSLQLMYVAYCPNRTTTELSYNKWFSGVYFSHSWRRFH